ncbi:hypothetical protein CXB51_022149 [Gossypium anomalum]|uniref:Uncharacterized protein n=1 Tax=Gossypium anomalum TaxID=47600 RepID=A0A8J6CQ18_9ROSI|nr:hypothetical protein CXB51_022149 [Gossypium anomalum]
MWNHSASYVGIPIALEDIRLPLDQRSEVHTPYEDPAIQAVIPDEFFQNPNILHVKVLFINYATVEMHQTNRLLRQFGFRQPILVTLEVLDDEHKSTYELACVPNYMSSFRIHDKPYLLLEEQRRRAYTITKPKASSNNVYTTAPSDYAKCVS